MELLRSRPFARVAGALGIVLQLLAASSFVLVAGLTVPFPAAYVFMLTWVVLLALTIVWVRHHPWRSLAVPLVSVPVVTIVFALGGRYLGWGG